MCNYNYCRFKTRSSGLPLDGLQSTMWPSMTSLWLFYFDTLSEWLTGKWINVLKHVNDWDKKLLTGIWCLESSR